MTFVFGDFTSLSKDGVNTNAVSFIKEADNYTEGFEFKISWEVLDETGDERIPNLIEILIEYFETGHVVNTERGEYLGKFNFVVYDFLELSFGLGSRFKQGALTEFESSDFQLWESYEPVYVLKYLEVETSNEYTMKEINPTIARSVMKQLRDVRDLLKRVEKDINDASKLKIKSEKTYEKMVEDSGVGEELLQAEADKISALKKMIANLNMQKRDVKKELDKLERAYKANIEITDYEIDRAVLHVFLKLYPLKPKTKKK